MSKKIAIIDLGTNTFNLLLARQGADKRINYLLRSKEGVMLGKEGLNDGKISSAAQLRAYNVLKAFAEQIKKHDCQQTIAIATSAIRSASNMTGFIKKIKSELGIKIKTISGSMEADFIYEGVKNAVKFTSENYLILDIGGGSNEFIIANENEVLWKHSFDLGVARLLQFISPSDPIKQEEIVQLNDYLTRQLFLLQIALENYPVTQLIGASGVFDNFVRIIDEIKQVKHNETSTYKVLTLSDFSQISKKIIASTHSERLHIKGLEAIRVDVAVMATLFTNFVIKLSKVKGIIQSAYSMKEGVFFYAVRQ